jgi:hypothetical protein
MVFGHKFGGAELQAKGSSAKPNIAGLQAERFSDCRMVRLRAD